MDKSTNQYYSERQKFDQSWIKAIVYGLLIFGAVITLIVFFTKERSFFTFIPLIVTFILFLFFYKLQLILEVDERTINYCFFPFHLKKKTINKNDINEAAIVKYNPIGEYGGWGIRFGVNGKAYTVSGNYGLQFRYKGKNVLIGTRHPEELFDYLKSHGYDVKSLWA